MVETTRRLEIEDAASSLFRERGYSGTSVRDIARALDIQGASLYAHVDSKQDVLWSIVAGTATRFETAADTAIAKAELIATGGASARLSGLVHAHVGVVTDDVGRASVFVHEWRSLGSERRSEIARRRDAYEARFRAIIDEGVEAGTFGPSDSAVTAAFILTALNGLVAWYRPDGRIDPADIAESYADLVLRAVMRVLR